MRHRQACRTGTVAVGAVASVTLALGACQSGNPPGPPEQSAARVGSGGCSGQRPYAPSSPWNTPISTTPTIDTRTPSYQKVLTATGQTLTSDVDQYTIGLYCPTPDTPRTSITLTGYYSDYTSGTRIGHGTAPTITNLPIPTTITPPPGSDGQIVIWDQDNNIEYGFWQFTWTNGHATATNGYAIRTDTTSPGRFADGLAGRGAGLPYLAGLVRPTELATGHIDHALAFAYPYPSREFTFPASKSDGKGTTGTDLPEGTRLQLDPTLTTTDLTNLGITPTALPIARALQQYGMYLVDNSGSTKTYLQDRTSAAWDTTINRTVLGAAGSRTTGQPLTRTSLGRIPWTRFRAVSSPGAGASVS